MFIHFDLPFASRVCLLLTALGAVAPTLAQTASGVTVTSLTSLRPAGDDVTTPDGTAGWPGARYPTSPPLYAKRASSGIGYLYGGFLGGGVTTRPSIYTAAGLYSMRAGVSIYERLPYAGDDLQGRINGTPVRASDGSLYGVMTGFYGERYAGQGQASGLTYSATVGRGLLFRTDDDGTHLSAVASTVGKLYTPNGALVIDANDNLYGLDKGPEGNGRLFKVAKDGTLSTVHTFAVGPNGMPQVVNDLILGSDGVLYGVTAYDRGLPNAPTTPSATDTPVGTIYRIDPALPATFAVLHTFTLAEGEINVADNVTSDGNRQYPSGLPYVIGTTGEITQRALNNGQQTGLSSLVEGGDGYLYGATSVGDCYTYTDDRGSLIYKLVSRDSPLCGYAHWDASVSTAFYGFNYRSAYPYYDGPRPHGALYRIAKNGSGGLQLIHSFDGSAGSTPRGPMTVGSDGRIYGTTLSGGTQTCANGAPSAFANAEVTCGVLYRFDPKTLDGSGRFMSGGVEVVHNFQDHVDGQLPMGVRSAADGRLYGATSLGGSYRDSQGNVVETNYGTVFQVALSGDGAPAASASLIASNAQFIVGGTATLTWLTEGAENCTMASSAGDWTGAVATFGSRDFVPPAGTYRYTLTCNVTGSSGAQVSASTTIYISATATSETGTEVNYGNGGSGPVGPLALAALATLAALRRRRTG